MYRQQVEGLPEHIHCNLLDFPSASFDRLNHDEMLYISQKQMEEISKYNFTLKSKLVRPRVLLGFALLLQEASGRLNEDFFESQTFQLVRDWASVCEMIHNSSLIHVGTHQDDYFDDAVIRRDQECVHAKFGLEKASMSPIFISGRW